MDRVTVAARALAAAYTLALFLVSLQPEAPNPTGTPTVVRYNVDEVEHFFAYSGLAALWWLALRPLAWRFRAALMPLLVAATGAIDELLQTTQPHRYASLADLLADALAGLVLVVVLWLGRRVDPPAAAPKP